MNLFPHPGRTDGPLLSHFLPVPAGTVCAIMGPSGAGKSSILNVLAGRSASAANIEITGTITVAGQRINPVEFRERIAYVMQDDSLLATATPREALEFSAQLRLPGTMSRDEIRTLIDGLIEDLGLESCADTMIGGALIKGISGGQRKRTSVGVELITDPGLIFLDEPTSGLDSFSAFNMIALLRVVAASNAADHRVGARLQAQVDDQAVHEDLDLRAGGRAGQTQLWMWGGRRGGRGGRGSGRGGLTRIARGQRGGASALTCAENSRASRGVAVASNESSCITYAMRSRNATGLIFVPPTEMFPVISMPAADADRPASTLRMLDLPAPEGPMMAATFPLGTSPQQSFRIVLLPRATLKLTWSHATVLLGFALKLLASLNVWTTPPVAMRSFSTSSPPFSSFADTATLDAIGAVFVADPLPPSNV